MAETRVTAEEVHALIGSATSNVRVTAEQAGVLINSASSVARVTGEQVHVLFAVTATSSGAPIFRVSGFIG